MDKTELKRKYTGESAVGYEDIRANSEKWNREQETVKQFLAVVMSEYDINSILDVPVGTGRFLPLYREYSADVLGLDASEDMLAEAAKKETSTLDVTLEKGDIFALGESDIAVDLVVCIRFLNWIETDELSDILHNLSETEPQCSIIGVRIYPSDDNSSSSTAVSEARASVLTRVIRRLRKIGELSHRAVQILRQEGIRSLGQSTTAFIRNQFASDTESTHTITVHNQSDLNEAIGGAGFEIVNDSLIELGDDGSEYRFYLLHST